MERRPDVARFAAAMQKLPEVLDLFGFKDLRKGQDKVVYTLMQGRDTLGVLPTGCGKTACFIIPALALDYSTLIMSPLVALMQDQVQSLRKKRIKAVQVSGMQTESENQDAVKMWVQGQAKVMYAAPERLANPAFLRALKERPPQFIVIDEAHVCSQWSDNFRSSYRLIGDLIRDIQPKLVATFTATCPAEVEADIRRVFQVPNVKRVCYMPRRSNLKLSSAPYESAVQLSRLVQRAKTGSVIVYCPTIGSRYGVEETAKALQDTIGPYDVTFFHGELPNNVKRTNQEAWMSGESRIVVATNAFGMGIDQANVRMVVHREMPGSLEALAQEVGRAGRDGKDSECVTLFGQDGRSIQEYFIECGHPDRRTITAVYEVLSRAADPTTRIVQMSANDIGFMLRKEKVSGKASKQIDAARHILKGSGVVEPVEDYPKLFRITQKLTSEDARFRKYMEQVVRCGSHVGQHTYDFDLDELSQAVGVGPSTVRAYLNNWGKEGWIKVIPPGRSQPLRIVGDLSMVEFDRLRVKEQQAWEKLHQVEAYLSTPDERKHKFLEDYFGVESSD